MGGEEGIRPLLATDMNMYRAGHMPGGNTEPPPSTQQLLQPSQAHGARASVKMQEGILCQSSLSNFTSSSNPNLMSRLNEIGMEERPKFHPDMQSETKRTWTPRGASESLDHSQLWQRRDQDTQMAPKLSPPPLPVAPKDASRSAQSKQYLSRLLQDIAGQPESSRQWKDIHDINQQVRPDLPGGHVTAASPVGTAAAFMHDRHASASPSDHAMSEDRTSEVELRQVGSPDVGLKRTGSASSEDIVDMDSLRGGRGRSLPRNNNNNNNNNTVSKNLVSERKRRKKLNDGLYSLRALVPKISKMDKASIVGDAIEHVKELQQQIETIEQEIADLESKIGGNSVDEVSGGSMVSESGEHAAATTGSGVCEVVEAACKVKGEALPANDITNAVTVASTEDMISLADCQGLSPALDQKRILKMEVAKLEEQTYRLQISCQKGPGVLVQLTQALESLDLDVLNAHHTAFQENILNTFIVEIKSLDVGEAEEMRSTLIDAVAQHGLVQS